MAVTSENLEHSINILREGGATRVLLFGRALEEPDRAQDLDLACEGIPPKDFLKVVGRLLDELPILVDLIDLSDESPFVQHIRKRGKVVYERNGKKQ